MNQSQQIPQTLLLFLLVFVFLMNVVTYSSGSCEYVASLQGAGGLEQDSVTEAVVTFFFAIEICTVYICLTSGITWKNTEKPSLSL